MRLETQTLPSQRGPRRGGRAKRVVRGLIRGLLLYILPIGVIAGGIAGARRLIETAPKAERRDPARQATLVQVEPVSQTSANARIQVMGTVVPSRSIVLQPRVSGEVTELSPQFVPGGRFEKGEFMLQIDPTDYELSLERIRSQVAHAEYELRLEQGHQEIARHEWELLGMQDRGDGSLSSGGSSTAQGEKARELTKDSRPLVGDEDLALRQPQLLRVTAALKAAEAALREAELALERTTIRAPFNCVIDSETVDLGSQVSVQTQLARIVGTDEYWVQAAVPIDQLRWILFPEGDHPGSEALVRQELGRGREVSPGLRSFPPDGRAIFGQEKDSRSLVGQWRGQVVRLMSGLQPQGRMAQVLISVPDPLQSATLPLLIDAYVNVTIEGQRVEDAFALPRSALREDGRVWIMNDAGELDIREVDIIWRGRDQVLVRSGVREGEHLVLTDLTVPIAGMALAVGAERTPVEPLEPLSPGLAPAPEAITQARPDPEEVPHAR